MNLARENIYIGGSIIIAQSWKEILVVDMDEELSSASFNKKRTPPAEPAKKGINE